MCGQVNRGAEPCDAAADDEEVGPSGRPSRVAGIVGWGRGHDGLLL
jgi:hypothetical protein